MKICTLDGEWRGEGVSPQGEKLRFTGAVPGCVHTDLLRCGEIREPFWRYNADNCQWIEQWNWRYQKTFQLDSVPEGAYLDFGGLDTYCRIYVNGSLAGEADDMFVSWRFPVEKLLKIGENTVEAAFVSPIAMVAGRPERPAAFTSERLYTRRMQCTYSWDWVNRFVTCGIFRPVWLCAPEQVTLEHAYIATRQADAFSAQLTLDYEFTGGAPEAYVITRVLAPDGRAVFAKRRLIVEREMREMIDVASPELWWPAGYGEQPLYTLEARVEIGGAQTQRREIPFGIRTVHILQLPDHPGTPYFDKCLKIKGGPHVSGENASWDRNKEDEFSGFILLINGVRVFCQGANWVPCEPFPSAETPEKIGRLLSLAKEGGMNMIRVWGGGIFEQDAFYEECDRLGLMVTQDFLMACGVYPENEPDFLSHLSMEAACAAHRLRNHPCLVWWTGDNENAMASDENMPDYPGRKSALSAIAPVLKSLDPYRDFLPASPYGGTPNGSITKGTTHNTNYIGEMFSYIRFQAFEDYGPYFDQYLSRFCAEEATMGSPMVSSLRRFMTDQDIFGDDDEIWRYHTKNNPAEAFREFQIFDYLKAIAEKLMGTYESGQDRVFKMQYVQYEWVRSTLELYRRNAWFSAGVIYWMLDDCWPASGWSLIDYYGAPKAAWYAFKDRGKALTGCIERGNGGYRALISRLGPAGGRVRYSLFVQNFAGPRTLLAEGACDAPANGVVCAAEAPEAAVRAALGPDAILILEISGDGGFDRAFHFPCRPKDLALPKTAVTARLTGDSEIALSAPAYVHAVGLDGPFVFSDNFFPLLPGEVKTVSFRRVPGLTGGEIEVRYLGMDAPAIPLLVGQGTDAEGSRP